MKQKNNPTNKIQDLDLKKTWIDNNPCVTNDEIIEFFDEVIEDHLGSEWIGQRGPRAYYTAESIVRVLMFASLDQTSPRDAAKYLQEDIASGFGTTPSRNPIYTTLRNKFDNMDREEIEDYASTIFQAYVKSLPEIKYSQTRNRLLWEAKGIHISFDPHEEVCHFEDHLFDQNGNQVTMMGQLKENRGRKVFRYCTAAIVFGDDHPRPPLTIGLVLIYKGESRVQVVKRLLDQIRRMEVKIDMLSCDGEFYTKDVVEYLDSLDTGNSPRRYLIRGKYSAKKDYPGRVNGPGFPYEINKGTKEAYQVEGYLIEQETPQGKETRFLISSTYNRLHYSEIKRIYKRRFRIENTFRHTRNCKIITSCDNFARRIMLWAFSHFVELLWEIFRVLLQNDIQNGGYNYRYDLRQKRFLRIISDHIKFKIRLITRSRRNDRSMTGLKCDCKFVYRKDG